MHYWEDFQDKFGFNDGGATPPDAEICRDLYMRVVNKLAGQLDSQWRVIPFDHPTHNGYRIYFRPVDWEPQRPDETDDEVIVWRDYETDEAMQQAIDHACSLDLDENFVIVNTQLTDDFQEFFDSLAIEKEEDEEQDQ